MDNLIFTKELNMEKTNNFLSHLDKAKAEKIKEKELENTTNLLTSVIIRTGMFFISNAFYYLAYSILSSKLGWLKFNYFEILSLQVAIYFIFTSIVDYIKKPASK